MARVAAFVPSRARALRIPGESYSVQAEGAEVTTIEGLAPDGQLYFPVVGALERFHALRYALAAILTFVGAKLLLSDLIEIPNWAASSLDAVSRQRSSSRYTVHDRRAGAVNVPAVLCRGIPLDRHGRRWRRLGEVVEASSGCSLLPKAEPVLFGGCPDIADS